MPGFKYPSDEACGFRNRIRRPQYDDRSRRPSHVVTVEAKIKAVQPPLSGDRANIPKADNEVHYTNLTEAAREELKTDSYENLQLKAADPSDYKIRHTKYLYELNKHKDGKTVWLMDNSAYLIWPVKKLPQ